MDREDIEKRQRKKIYKHLTKIGILLLVFIIIGFILSAFNFDMNDLGNISYEKINDNEMINISEPFKHCILIFTITLCGLIFYLIYKRYLKNKELKEYNVVNKDNKKDEESDEEV